MTVILRDYQEEIVNELRVNLREFKHILIQSECGTGKSRIIEFIIRNSKIRFIVVVPSIRLLKNLTQYFSDLNPGILHDKNVPNWDNDRIILTTAATLHSRFDQIPSDYIPDYFVLDECHHAKADTWEKTLKDFQSRGSKTLGFTATPQRLDGKGFDDLFQKLIVGKGVAWHIKNGSLSHFEHISEDDEGFDIQKLIGKGTDQLDKQSKVLNTPEVRKKHINLWQKYAHGKKTIYYASGVQHSKDICSDFNQTFFNEYGRNIACHIDSKTPESVRDDYEQRFINGEFLILCNVDIFGEGNDIPGLEAVVLGRFTNSYTIYCQQVGRVIRPKDGKTAIIIDTVKAYLTHLKIDAKIKWSLEKGAIKPKREVEDKEFLCPHCDYEIHESRAKFMLKNPGIESILCPECHKEIKIRKKPKPGDELEFLISGKIGKIVVTNNIIRIWNHLKTFHTKRKPDGTKYLKNWIFFKLDAIDDLTLDEIRFALMGVNLPVQAAETYLNKRRKERDLIHLMKNFTTV